MAKKLRLKKQRKLRLNTSVNKKVIIIAAIVLAVVIVVGVAAALLFRSPVQPKDEIYVKQLPKTKYFVGELASYDGLVVEAVFSNGERKEIDLDECKIVGFSTENVTDSLSITIIYKGLSCSYSISVKEFPKELVSIEMKTLPTKQTYKLDEWIDPTGGVILCKFSDGTTKEVDLIYRHIKEFAPEGVGEYVITVVYEDDTGRRATTTFTVMITE